MHANPSKTSNINGQRQPMLANSENSKAHSHSSSSKPPLMLFGTNDNKGTLTSPANHLGDNNDLELQAEMEDESLKFIVDQRDKVAHKDDSKDFTFAHPYITSSEPPEIFGSGCPNLPWVSTKGSGPKGRTIYGVTYGYSETQIKIVCACHGSHMSPEEFVRHASEENVNLENGNGSASASFPSTDPAYIEPWSPGFSSLSRGTQEDKLVVKTSGIQSYLDWA
ncbi:uncharacterized protein LOC119371070 [Jatropha curcas]|uniref:uncharacterized protein LOC119369898 n=1 Tax=Jatropha curcas TaxID=180498 RepID=UPI001895B13E|nr:uncharacterized protein LOC119369898 [Jatropha curcas]XP_037496471.1 uncharacterized protein LOC119371070 [Jatropha curcas]